MTPSPPPPRFLPCLVLALALPWAAHAADSIRSPCSLTPASDDLVSDSTDARSLFLEPRKPTAIADWDVRWHQRQRLWVTLAATNRGDAPATVRAEFAIDLQPDGGRSGGLAAPARTLPAHATATQRLALYVPGDARTVAVLLHAVDPGASVVATLALECSDRRFDAGEMTRPAAALLDEALKTYSADLAEPIQNPHLALETVRIQASGAQDATDVAWAMRFLMSSLNDAHSYVLTAGEAAPAAPVVTPRAPVVELRGDGLALVRLSAVGAGSDAELLAVATKLHEQLAAAAARHPRGWIVDLRDDGGGDMWAALAALSPLLQGPSVGAFAGHDGRQEWIVDRGAARVAGARPAVDLQLAPEPALVGPVAVLVGPGTAGAGEALAVAFEGRPRTRFFGAPTQGRDDEAIATHTLSDGTVLGVLALRKVDRDGVVYRGPIEPDKRVAEPGEAVPPEALDWLEGAH